MLRVWKIGDELDIFNRCLLIEVDKGGKLRARLGVHGCSSGLLLQ